MSESQSLATDFDLKLALECAKAFFASTGLGCTVSDTAGNILYEAGYGCGSCAMCLVAGADMNKCIRVHSYGMMEAERFGGKYIYFCSMGLTCFVSPIVGRQHSVAKITVGPFLMVDEEDYIVFDLMKEHGLTSARLEQAVALLRTIPSVPSEKVSALSTLLFMAVGFMNNVSMENRMLDIQSVDFIQGQIGTYISQLKQEVTVPQYPFVEEKRLLDSIMTADREQAQTLLVELMGHILSFSGGSVLQIKVRLNELMTQVSRAAIDAGAAPEYSFVLNCEFFEQAQGIDSVDRLCFLASDIIMRFIDSVFSRTNIRHVDIMRKSLQYIRAHYTKKLSLEEVAGQVFISPSYYSKLFKKEVGCNFSIWLNRLRVERSKILLLQNLRVVDIAVMVGFEDQSYFSKVFKHITGITPKRYQELGGRV